MPKTGNEVLKWPVVYVPDYNAENTGDPGNRHDMAATQKKEPEHVYLGWTPKRGQYKITNLGESRPKN